MTNLVLVGEGAICICRDQHFQIGPASILEKQEEGFESREVDMVGEPAMALYATYVILCWGAEFEIIHESKWPTVRKWLEENEYTLNQIEVRV